MEESIKKKNIEHLLHFTRAKNISSILTYGLLPVNTLEENKIETVVNDTLRLDNWTDAVSLSVEFPNYKYLLKLRQQDRTEDWVIIFMKPDILFEKKCAYCYENASNENVMKIPLEEKLKLEMFEKMFEDIETLPSRRERRIKRFYTTSPQAEILVFGKVEPSYFHKLVFMDFATLNNYRLVIPKSLKCEIIPDYFYAREDYIFDVNN